MARAGTNTKQAFLLAAAIAAVALAIPAGRWLGSPRPVSGTAPVAWPKGPPLPLPAPASLSRCQVRRFGAKEWQELPVEAGRKALAALAHNHEALPPPGVIEIDYGSPSFEIQFTTSSGHLVRLAMSSDGIGICDHEAQAPDGQVSGNHGRFVVEGEERWDVRDAIAPVLSDGGPGDGKQIGPPPDKESPEVPPLPK